MAADRCDHGRRPGHSTEGSAPNSRALARKSSTELWPKNFCPDWTCLRRRALQAAATGKDTLTLDPKAIPRLVATDRGVGAGTPGKCFGQGRHRPDEMLAIVEDQKNTLCPPMARATALFGLVALVGSEPQLQPAGHRVRHEGRLPDKRRQLDKPSAIGELVGQDGEQPVNARAVLPVPPPGAGQGHDAISGNEVTQPGHGRRSTNELCEGRWKIGRRGFAADPRPLKADWPPRRIGMLEQLQSPSKR